MYAGDLWASWHEDAGTQGAAREAVRLPARRAWQAGPAWLWPARYERTRAQLLYAEHTAHMLTGRVGRQGGGGGAYPQSGEGGHGPGDGLAHRRELMRCEGRICWANAELCAQCAGCLCKAVQGSRGCGACWTGERLRRAVHGLVGRELRCDVRCGLWRASAGCRGGGLRASCAWGCGIVSGFEVKLGQFQDSK